ncbi:MAG TPA: N-6 DNA methylase [Bacteroidales bacterium]|nr:N-6 DNA methylase [Bacteroidales bacterium]
MRSKARAKSLGEVFTPPFLVERMLRKLPKKFFKDHKYTVLDNSCGNGNFLVEVAQWRMINGISHEDAISTIYGVDIDMQNVVECRNRLLMGKKDKVLQKIVEHNIICADSLDPDHNGWDEVGYMWDKSRLTSRAKVKVFFDE